MPRPKDSTAIMLEIKDDAPPPLDWVPDRLEAIVGSPVGSRYHIGNGRYKRLSCTSVASKSPRHVVRAAAMHFLTNNSGEFTSLEISAQIDMHAGDVLTALRQAGQISAVKRNGKYYYSRLENER
jgi:hypothetical protein